MYAETSQVSGVQHKSFTIPVLWSFKLILHNTLMKNYGLSLINHTAKSLLLNIIILLEEYCGKWF
jgi:hypothetical protein